MRRLALLLAALWALPGYAAITYEGVGTAATAVNTANVTPTNPTHLTGDVLIAFHSLGHDNGDGATISVGSSGWTQIGTVASPAEAGNNPEINVYCKVAASGATTNPTFTMGGTFSTGDTQRAQVITLRGALNDCSTIVAHSATAATVSGAGQANIITTPAMTVSTANTAILMVGYKVAQTWTSVATLTLNSLSWTEIAEISDTNGQDAGIVWDVAIETTATNISAGSFTITGATPTNTIRNIAIALSLKPAVATPSFSVAPTVTAHDDNDYTLGYTPSASATFYAVAYESTLSAPSCTQIKAAQNQTGASAIASANEAVTGADTTVVSIPGTPRPKHNLAACLNNAGGDSAVTTITNSALDAPSGYQFITLASIGTGSPCESFNAATNPDLAANDILRAPTTTSPSAFALTVGTDCQFSYTGDASRQSALNVLAYDNSVGAYHADDIDFWSNNLTPIPPDPDSIILSWQEGVAITPIDLKPYCPDPEGDDVTVTEVSGLAAGLNISTSTLSGTPTTRGISTLVLRCTDITGAYVDWQ